MSNHKRSCQGQKLTKEQFRTELGELKQQMVELVQSAGAKVVIQGDHNNIVVNQVMPGWPASWCQLNRNPAPFEPPSFTLSLANLEAAAKLCPDASGGDPESTAAFMVELLRCVHSDPEQRNVYPDPNREDQVLTFAFSHWEVRRLVDAIRILYTQLENELEGVALDAPPSLQKAAEGVQTGLRTNRKRVLRETQTALRVHLTNLRLAAESGESWLGQAPSNPNLVVRPFGREWRAHLDRAATLAALESALGDDQADLAAAAQSLVAFARMLLRGRPENLTVLLLPNRRAATRASAEWVETSVEEAAAGLVANMSGHLCGFIQGRETSLARLVPLLEQHALLTEHVGATLLQQYAAAAEAHYSKLPEAKYGPGQEAKAMLRRAATLGLEGVYAMLGL